MTTAITPFQVSEYFRKAAPDAARRGTRGYILRVLLDMARLKGADAGTCFPSVSYLAGLIGRSVRHVRRALSDLEALGELERIARRRDDGGQSSNRYRLRGLIAWAAENVRGASDTRVRHNPFRKNLTPSRGVKSVSGYGQAAPARPAPAPSPAASGRSAMNEVPKNRGLSPAQVSEAKRLCDPVRWEGLKLQAAVEDGTSGDLIEEGAARRWRADAIMRGVQLVA